MDKQKLLKNYYIDNPDAEIRDRRSQILSATIPGAFTVPVAIALYAKKRGIPFSALNKADVAFAGSMGAITPAAAYSVDKAVSRNKALKEMGVQESLLGSYLAPFREKINL